jgi:hypothetical protein
VAGALVVAVALAAAEMVALVAVQRHLDRGREVSALRLASAMETFRPPDRRGLARSVNAPELDPAQSVRATPSRCAPLTVLALGPAADGQSWTGVNGSPAQPVTTLTVRYAAASAARAELRAKQLALLRCQSVRLTFPPFDAPSQEFIVSGRLHASNLLGDRLSYVLVGGGKRYGFYVRRYANTLTWTYADDVSMPQTRQQVVDSLVAQLWELDR